MYLAYYKATHQSNTLIRDRWLLMLKRDQRVWEDEDEDERRLLQLQPLFIVVEINRGRRANVIVKLASSDVRTMSALII